MENAQSFIVEFHGNFIPLQGVPYIIEAARIVQDADASIEFVIIGKGQTYEEVRRLADTKGVHNCQFVGRVPFAEVRDYIAQADVCLGIFGDTDKAQRVIPNKVYEALAMQKPVVTADTPAARELLTHKETAWLVPVADPGALAEAITELYSNSELRKTLAEAGQQQYQKKATPLVIGQVVMKSLVTQ